MTQLEQVRLCCEQLLILESVVISRNLIVGFWELQNIH